MVASNNLTARQTEIFDFIVTECSAGRTVGVRDIAVKFEFRPNAAKGHVDILYKKGFIESEKTPSGSNRANSIRPIGMVPITNNAYSRSGENFAVNIVNGGSHVAFMIFSETGMIESGLYPIFDALKMADNMRIDANLPIVDRIAAVAAKVAAKRVPAVETV